MFSKTQTLLLALAAAKAAQAHTAFTNFYVNGVSEGDGTCVRMNSNPPEATFPVPNILSNDLACGIGGQTGVSRVCPVPGGSTMTFEFRAHPDNGALEPLDPGHKGPCAVYMKKVDSAVDDAGAGDGWFKIWEDGYDESSGQWCTDRMIANGGLISVQIPDGIEGGYYLVRPEVLALHAAVSGDPQFYTGCAQIFLESDGTAVADTTVSIPGYVQPGQKSVSFNLYDQPLDLPYPIPGSPVTGFTSNSAKRDLSERAIQRTQDEGQRPAGCVLENGNWCGIELPSYSGEQACWAASEACWDQGEQCWNSAPPTGGAGCEIWSSKCRGIQEQCSARNFQGPPDAGRDLTPARATCDTRLSPGNNVSGSPGSSPAPPNSSPSQQQPSAPDNTGSPSNPGQPQNPPVYGPNAPTQDQPSTPVTEEEEEASGPAASPAPTSPPELDGLHVIYETVYETVVVTATEYTTVTVDVFERRHARHMGAHARRGSH